MNLKQIIAFSILMENGEGLLCTNPVYIFEKFDKIKNAKNPENQLSDVNKKKFENYFKKWRPYLPQNPVSY